MFKILILIIYLQDMYICNCNGGSKQSLHVTCMNEGQKREKRVNNNLQNTTQKTTTYKTLHRKQQPTKHYTENNNLQNTTQKTTIYKTLYRKQ